MTNEHAGDVSFSDDDELLTEFLTWSQGALVQMRAIIDELTRDAVRGDDGVCELYDLAHNIKGMGASFGFDLMTDVGLSLCGYLKNIEPDELIANRVLSSHVRVFEVVLQNRIKGNGGEQGAALKNRLAAIIQEEAP
ncbi:MAG: Hpt domain-containing protein [Kordiimonadaceae bacterium]|nr:Hpt domain-containing protein [Kordiimonadaceae bacterium]